MSRRDEPVVTLEFIGWNGTKARFRTRTTDKSKWGGTSAIKCRETKPGMIGSDVVDHGSSKPVFYGDGEEVEVEVETKHRHHGATHLIFYAAPCFPASPQVVVTDLPDEGVVGPDLRGYERYPRYTWPRWLRKREDDWD